LYRDADLAQRTRAARAALAAAERELQDAEPAVALECDAWEAALRRRHGDVRWVDADVVAAPAEAGSEMEVLADGSVRAHGNPERESHVLELATDAENLRVLRLDVLPDPGNGKGSVGLASHGNVVISAVRAEAISRQDPQRVEPIPWSWAWADHEQPNND